MEHYWQLSAKLHLISKRLVSCLLTTCLFSTAISPVCSPSQFLLGFKFPDKSPAFSTYVICQNNQQIQQLVFFKILVCFSKRSWPYHFPPNKTRVLAQGLSVSFHIGLHEGASICTDRRLVGWKWRHNQTKISCTGVLTKSLINGAPRARAPLARAELRRKRKKGRRSARPLLCCVGSLRASSLLG